MLFSGEMGCNKKLHGGLWSLCYSGVDGILHVVSGIFSVREHMAEFMDVRSSRQWDIYATGADEL